MWLVFLFPRPGILCVCVFRGVGERKIGMEFLGGTEGACFEIFGLRQRYPFWSLDCDASSGVVK